MFFFFKAVEIHISYSTFSVVIQSYQSHCTNISTYYHHHQPHNHPNVITISTTTATIPVFTVITLIISITTLCLRSIRPQPAGSDLSSHRVYNLRTLLQIFVPSIRIANVQVYNPPNNRLVSSSLSTWLSLRVTTT